MHDLHLADKILNIVLKEAHKNNATRVKLIKIELGEISEHNQTITPENLEFNFSMLAKNTVAEEAKLDIEQVEGDEWKLKEIDIER